MKIVMTVQLQQDNGTPVFTGTQTKTAFSPNSAAIAADYAQAKGFLSGSSMEDLLKLMCWISAGQLSLSGTPTVTINNL